MKKILVPTDFSENARNAMAYAIEIANLFGSHIHLLHTYRMPSKAGMFMSVESFMLDEIRPTMKKWVEEVQGSLTAGGQVSYTILRDDIIHATKSVSGKEQIDLIVMGTQGASGLKEVFIGSTTSAVLQHCKLPLLAVPNGVSFRPIRNIVLAMDDQDVSSVKVVEPMVDLARAFDSKVLVYHLETEDDAGVDPSLAAFLGGLEHSFHFEVDAKDLKDCLYEFVNDFEADLLCMIRRPKWIFDRLFGSSVTLKAVFNSSVPLLVLRDRS